VSDSLTPNIGALIADPADVVQYAPHIGNNYTLFDSLMGAVDCLSTARPTVTYKGQIIYERDSRRYAQNIASSAAPSWSYMSHAALSVTAATRPTSGLASGGLAYETDTNGLLKYTGAAWNYAAPLAVTSSTRPTTAVSSGMLIYETDTKRLLASNGSSPTSASWEQKAFSNFVCASSARPASPFTGLEIYETDTGVSAVYNGSSYAYGVQQIAPTQVLGVNTASITFTGIPAATRLLLTWRGRSSVSGSTNVQLRIDGNTGNNYLWNKIESGSGTAAGSHSGAAVAFMVIGSIDAAATSYFGSGQQMIDGWSNATGFANISGTYNNFNTTTVDSCGTNGGLFLVVGPHTSLTIFPAANSFAPGSQFSLYALM
jgi:hypothetical protein